MEEQNDINNEIFNVVNENLSIKEIAYKCKKINPKIIILKNRNDPDQRDYFVSNKKIEKTGFKFRCNHDWSFDYGCAGKIIKKKLDLEYLKQGEKEKKSLQIHEERLAIMS